MTESPTHDRQDENDPNDSALNAAAVSAQKSKLSLSRLLPLIFLGMGLIVAFSLDLHRYLNFETLQQNRTAILDWKHENYTLSTLAYFVAYSFATAISIPGAIWLTLVGGFMFGTLKGGVLVVFAATSGATIVFLAARYAFADFFHAKCSGVIQKMEMGFQENAFSYLLVLRFVPLFPFWLVNLVPAFLGVATRTFIVSTFIGIIPGTFVFASLGNGLGHIIDQGAMPDMAMIWAPEILLPLLGLAALALVPVVYRKLKT